MTLEWFNSYLKECKQKVMIQRRLSSPQSITTGVPQGSISVPYYYYTCHWKSPKSTVEIYADDTTQIARVYTVEEVGTIVTHELRLQSR